MCGPRSGWISGSLSAWLAALLLAVLAAQPARAQAVVELDPAAERQPVDAAIEVVEDAAGSLGLDGVRALPDAAWTHPAVSPLPPGYAPVTRWVRVRVHNPVANGPQERLFEVGSPLQDYVAVSIVRANGAVQSFKATGDREDFDQRPIAAPTPVFELKLAAGDSVQIFVRLSTYDGQHELTPLTLWSREALIDGAQLRSLAFGAYYGVSLMLLIYCGFMIVLSRDRLFVIYGTYLCAVLVSIATFSGHALQYLWPHSPRFNNQVLPMAINAAMFLSVMFMDAILCGLDPAMKRWLKICKAVAACGFLASTPALLGHYALAFVPSMPLSVVASLGQLGCSLALSLRGKRQAVWLSLGWSMLVLSVLVYSLQMVGVLRPTPHILDVIVIGCALQVVLMGLGLADTVERLRRDKLTAQSAARAVQENLAATLEAEVRQRTQALEHANQQLRELTITDGLTGVFNRRHFNQELESELARLQRVGDMPALCLLDVDHFKRYNDLYGHHKGDAALKTIAATLVRHLRRAGDRVFRVGGEEFALLLQPDDPDLQRQHVESLRVAIEALRLPHEGNPGAGVVTASFGLVQMPPPGGERTLTASGLYREADRLLYSAKEGGRNRVMCDRRPIVEWASTDFKSESGEALA